MQAVSAAFQENYHFQLPQQVWMCGASRFCNRMLTQKINALPNHCSILHESSPRIPLTDQGHN